MGNDQNLLFSLSFTLSLPFPGNFIVISSLIFGGQFLAPEVFCQALSSARSMLPQSIDVNQNLLPFCKEGRKR